MAIRNQRFQARPRSHRRAAAALLLGTLMCLGLLAGGAGHARAAWAPTGSLPGLGGGRIWQVVFSPADPTQAVAATDKGVYTSRDAGATWTASALSAVRVWTVGFDARDAGSLYAGLQGAGIRVSHDLGKSWQDVSAGLSNRNIRCFGFSLGGIAAGTDDGVALSIDGTAWHIGGLGGYSISALAVAANNPAPTFIAGVDGGDVSKGFLFSGGTGGQWQALTNGLSQNAVVSSVTAGPLTQPASPRPLMVTTSRGTLRSGDGGSTWTPSTGIPDAVFLTTTAFSPQDTNLVYGGADAGGSSGGALLRSTDGGQTFAAADQGLPTPPSTGQPVRKEVESIAVAPTSPPTLLAAVNPFDGNARIYRNVDTSAPTPAAAVVTESGQATIVPGTPAPKTATPRPGPAVAATPTPAPGLLGRLAGGVLHFPDPLLFEIMFIGLTVFLFQRWRRRYYVEGPP